MRDKTLTESEVLAKVTAGEINPFAETAPNGWMVPYCVNGNAKDRIDRIRTSTDLEWLGLVARWRGMQSTVKTAAQRRIRRIEKGAAK